MPCDFIYDDNLTANALKAGYSMLVLTLTRPDGRKCAVTAELDPSDFAAPIEQFCKSTLLPAWSALRNA